MTRQQAQLWDRQGGFEDAKFEASGVIDAFEKLGVTNDAEAMSRLSTRSKLYALHDSNGGGEHLRTTPLMYIVLTPCVRTGSQNPNDCTDIP